MTKRNPVPMAQLFDTYTPAPAQPSRHEAERWEVGNVQVMQVSRIRVEVAAYRCIGAIRLPYTERMLLEFFGIGE